VEGKNEMITLSSRLGFRKSKEEEEVSELMRNFSSCTRYAYNRLLEGWERKELKKHLQFIFPLNSRYCDDAIMKANESLKSCKERGQNPKKLVFGGRELFEKLHKRHLTGKRLEELRRKWKEKRQGGLYSRGDRAKKGNLNLRFVFIEGELCLRINTGKGNYVYAKVYRNVQKGRKNRDKWVSFIENLLIGEATGNYIPYSVELKKRNGKIYAFVSFEEKLPKIEITKECGVIGIDVNASPFHIAYAEVSKDGNLESFGKINLNHLIDKNKGEKELLSWKVAHNIVNLAKEKQKAIVIENFRKMSKGRRGDGRKKLRKRLHNFIYRNLLEKIEILARRKGIEVIKVNPAFTSVIGQLKYAPQYSIDKDIAGAFVTGRRGMGFKEEIPENYSKLLNRKDFLRYCLYRLEERKEELKEELRKETNKWKQNPIKAELKKISSDIKILKKEIESLKSSESDPATREQASGWNKPVRGPVEGHKSWRVLRAVLTFPLLGKSFIRDFSPLKPVLVEGKWERVVKGRVLVPGAGTTAQLTNVQFA